MRILLKQAFKITLYVRVCPCIHTNISRITKLNLNKFLSKLQLIQVSSTMVPLLQVSAVLSPIRWSTFLQELSKSHRDQDKTLGF